MKLNKTPVMDTGNKRRFSLHEKLKKLQNGASFTSLLETFQEFGRKFIFGAPFVKSSTPLRPRHVFKDIKQTMENCTNAYASWEKFNLRRVILKNSPVLMFLVLLTNMAGIKAFGQAYVQTTPGNYTWTCPPGVTSIVVKTWGAGGGGGGAFKAASPTTTASTGANASGGGGGAYAQTTISVVPGTTYNLTVGSGGAAGASTGGNGGAGGNTFFGNASAGNASGATVLAAGGSAGIGRSTAGQSAGALGGTIASSIGSIRAAGGNSSAASAASFASGGGSSAGANVAAGGTTGTGITGNTSGTPNGGVAPLGGFAGGNGTNLTVGGNGSNGTAGGGGGGGARRGTNATNRTGGAGGAGRIEICHTTWCAPTGTPTYYISNVSITGGITNFSNTTAANGGYAYFSAQSASQYAGSTVNFSVTHTATVGGAGVTVFVDWNNNGSFADVGDQIATTGAWNYGTFTGTMTVPAGASIGDKKLRIVVDYNATTPIACPVGITGESEDYTFTVVTPPACSAPSALVSSAITSTTATISWTAASPAPASGYQYYVSTSATAPTAGTTPTGTSAAGVTTANLTSLTANSTYYFWVRSNCGGAGTSLWTGSSSFFTGPCLPTGTSAYYISNLTTTGGTANIANATGSNAGYGNFIAQSASNSIGTGTNFSVAHNATIGGAGIGVWINWNNDLDFADANEQIAITTAWNYSPFTGTITIPVGTPAGNYRMRVVLNYDVITPGSCPVAISGESEDYTFTVITLPPCAGTPNPGATTATSSQVFAGGSTTLGITTAQTGTGVSYVWQSGPSATGPWTAIGGATSATYVASPTAATYYRCIVTCSNGGATGTSTPILISFNAYCNPDYTGYTGTTPQNGNEGTVDGDMITNVTITLGATTLLNNTSTSALSSPQYTFYSSLPTINMYPSNTYNVNVTAGAFTAQNFAVWVDYNDDNDFSDAGELIGYSTASTSVAYQVVSFPINLACTPPLGSHRMRIRDVYNTAGSAMDPCATYGWGETEDYLITIVAGTPFAPVFTATPTTPSCMGAQVTYTATAGQTNYSWVPSGVNGTDYTINSGGTSTSNTMTITWLTNGSKTVTMNYASPLGCSSSGAVTNTITISPSITWANVQWPANATIACGASTNVYGRVYEPSLTPAGGANAGISVQVGVSTTNTNPATWPAAAWTNASYNAQLGNNDEYAGAIGASLTPGTYYYSFRYSNNGTACYVYGGFQGGYWNGTSNVNGVLTVNGVDWANLQFPGTGSICQSGTFSVYGQAYEPGVTESAGAGAGLTVQVGVNSANTDPSTWAAGAWSNATFNSQSGNNDEFTATLSGLAPNTYYYTFRYSLGNGCYQYGGFSATGGGIWNGTTNVSGTLTVNANPIVTASASSTTACAGQSLTLTGGGAASYSWNNGVTNALAFNPTASATYTVTGTSAAGCTGTANITVNINSLSTTTNLGNGDLIWHGRTSADYATISNWSQFNGSNLVPASAAPTSTTNVIIPVNQTCVTIQPNTNANNVNAQNVTIETGATMVMSNGTLSVAGNWTQFGNFVAGTGTVTFNGSSLSSISAPTGSSIAFNNLVMNNTGDVQLTSPITINGALTLTSGDLILGSNNLNMANAVINGGNSTSYVQTNGVGELRRDLTGTLVYPIGRSTYNPVTMAKAGAAYSFGARVVDQVTANGQDNGTSVSVANVGRMWHITPAAGYTAAANGAVDVTLSYLDNATYFANGFVNGSADRQFMHYGSSWENITNIAGAFTTGVDGNNYTWTTQSGVSNFSPFTITNSTTSLPIELISFQANCNDNKQIEVTWSTASEHNTSHYVVERIRDGINWTALGVVAAAGNSTQVLAYELLDATSQPGVNYYRLTQYDNDGAFEVFNVAAVTCGEEINSTQLMSYPNPSENSFAVALDTKEMIGTAVLSITDARGSVVYSKMVEIQHGHNVYHIADMTLTSGMYYIQVSNGTTSTDIVKHSLR